MATSYESRLKTSPEEGTKAPVWVSTTSNITLMGEQSINGVSVTAGKRVLVRAQNDATENGIYDVSAGLWERSSDFNDASDVVSGQMVPDNAGGVFANSAIWMVGLSNDSFASGITKISFVKAVSHSCYENSAMSLGHDPLFGKAGVKIVAGEDMRYHQGFGSFCPVEGKLIFINRKAFGHATENESEIWYGESFDGGQTIVNRRILLTGTDQGGVGVHTDLRCNTLSRLANGRIAFIVERRPESGSPLDPILMYTDDDGDTFTQKQLIRPVGSTAYSFNAHSGFTKLPLSQGGDDDEGFIAFGFMDASGQQLDYLKTTDNFNTYSWGFDVCDADGPESPTVRTISETTVIDIGSDRYLMYGRNGAEPSGWNLVATCWKTNNLTSWGPILPSGVNLNGNPPLGIYDEDTNKVHLFIPSRAGRNAYGNVFDNWLLRVEADADALWNADGDWSALDTEIIPVMPMPNWGTFYGTAFKTNDYWGLTFGCAEEGSESNNSAAVLAFLSDAVPSGIDRLRFSELLRRSILTRGVNITALDNQEDTYPLIVSNASRTASIQRGAYGEYYSLGGADYRVKIVNGTVREEMYTRAKKVTKAATNSTTDYPLEITNSAGSQIFKYGAYGMATQTRQYKMDLDELTVGTTPLLAKLATLEARIAALEP